jgi:ATP-dependent Clp protease adaptor protein ClpS
MSAATLPPPSTDERTAPPEADRKPQPRYNVILLDDDDHTYDYVIRMLRRVFAFGENRSYELAKEVDKSGRALLLTTTREHAELKQEQIHGFGSDPLIPKSKGSMSAVVEPETGPAS